jgi:hypothetical protein
MSAEHVARLRRNTKCVKIFYSETSLKETRRWKDNIEMNVWEASCQDGRWM